VLLGCVLCGHYYVWCHNTRTCLCAGAPAFPRVAWLSTRRWLVLPQTWVYPNQPWVWWGYIVLLALGLGGFCLGRGFTMMSIRLQTGYRVQRALSDGQVCWFVLRMQRCVHHHPSLGPAAISCSGNLDMGKYVTCGAAASCRWAQVCVKRNINYNGRLLHPKWKLNVWFPGVSPSSHLRSHHSSRPVVVFVHGGMYRFGDRGAVDNIGCAWAQNGCVVVTPSYRLFRPCTCL